MPIYKTALTSDFTQTSNALFNNESMPFKPKFILAYLLSKPKNWQLKVGDIKRRLNLGTSAIRAALMWLQQAGYIFYERLSSGKTIWHIFDRPREETASSPDIPPRVKNPHVGFQSDLVINKNTVILKQLPTVTAPTMPEPIQEVHVVVSDELIYPVQLTDPQKKAAKHIIKKVKEPELQQEVLFALAYAITSGTVKSAPAYLQGLVTRANNGTFEPVTATTASKQGGKPLIPIWQGFGQSSPSKPETATGFIQQARAALKGAKC
jgi:hypothetical protein